MSSRDIDKIKMGEAMISLRINGPAHELDVPEDDRIRTCDHVVLQVGKHRLCQFLQLA